MVVTGSIYCCGGFRVIAPCGVGEHHWNNDDDDEEMAETQRNSDGIITPKMQTIL